MTERTLGDVAAELEGLEGLIAMIELLVQPTETANHGSTPTQETVDRAFFSIEYIHTMEILLWEEA